MPDRPKVLIVNDDSPFMDRLLSQAEHGPIQLEWVLSLEEAAGKLSSGSYTVVVFKNPLQNEKILDRIPRYVEMADSSGIIVCSAEGSAKEAERLIMAGVYEYLPYPISMPDLVSAVTQVLESLLRREEANADNAIHETDWSRSFIGNSPQIRECLEMAVRAAQTEVSVLVTGETGTGKELLTELIHRESNRNKGNFIVVDCAALPEHLVESTLYGHEKGAFTSAERDRRGLVQEASGGTLFLDEIGELPLELQKRFLRVLDTRKFRKVGGQQELTSDFRLLAATHRDLDEMVARGEFRADLLHRIRTLRINLPPLRNRPEDIEPLALCHLEAFCEDMGQPVKKMSPRFLAALGEYAWPGNVRELFNSIERAVAAAGDLPVLQRFHLPVTIRAESARKVASRSGPARVSRDTGIAEENENLFPALSEYRQEAVAEAEVEYLRQLISRCRGDVEKAVRLSGLSRSRLYALLKEYGLSLKM